MGLIRSILLTITLMNFALSPLVLAQSKSRNKSQNKSQQLAYVGKSKSVKVKTTTTNKTLTNSPSLYLKSQQFNKQSGTAQINASIPTWSQKEKEQLSRYSDTLGKLGYKLRLDNEKKKALVYDKDNSLALEIPFSDEARLRKFSPKNFNAMLKTEMAKIKSANLEALAHSTKNIAPEFLMFSTSMAAIGAVDLVTNYSQNPVKMEQHISHSMSPMGIFGFYTFMYSQGLTSNVLSMYMKNPRFHHMIPYLGMTVGSFVQTYLSEILTDPNVRMCAKEMMGLQSTQEKLDGLAQGSPCDKAYEYLIIQRKLWEQAPGITSMLVSTALAGTVQSLASKAILKITGVDVALWLVPGGMQLKGIRLALLKTGVQTPLFLRIDEWLNPKITFMWKNFFDGFEFWSLQDELTRTVNDLKKSNWTASDQDFREKLKTFQSRMSQFRMVNLAEIYEAHENWGQALNQLTSSYNASQSFYEIFVGEINTARYDDTPFKPLLKVYPFNGVTAKNLKPEEADRYFDDPNYIESMQITTIREANEKIQKIVDVNREAFHDFELEHLNRIIKYFNSKNREEIISGLKYFAKVHQTNFYNTEAFSYVVDLLYKILGNPDPKMEPGVGYLAAYEVAPSTRKTFEKTGFYRQVGHVKTPHFTDYMLMQMMCGPDPENQESSIKQSFGYPAVFLPPTIRDQRDKFKFCETTWDPMEMDLVHKMPIKSASQKTHQGPISYLVNEARASAVGEDKTFSFRGWWGTKIESQMQSAFEKYSKSYDEIVAKLVKKIFQELRNASNTGPVKNGTIKAAFQELRAYLSLMDELIKPSPQYKLDLRFILQKEPVHPALKEVENQFIALETLLKKIRVENVNGDMIIQSTLENYELEEQFEKINKSLEEVSTMMGVNIEAEQIKSTLNSIIDAAAAQGIDVSKAMLAEQQTTKKETASDKKLENEKESNFKLNAQQTNLVVDCLQNIQSLAMEITMYGRIANAVSWEKIKNLKQKNTLLEQFDNESQAKFNEMNKAYNLRKK